MKPAYLHLQPGAVPPAMVAKPSLATLVAEEPVSDDWRTQIASWLVDSGCVYFVAWGIDCEIWHDTMDRVNVEAYDLDAIPKNRFVMTTWHDQEPLSEAFWFAGNCAVHPYVELQSALILHVAVNEKRDSVLKVYNEAQEMPAA